MRNNLWIGSGISGMGEIPILGNPVKGLTALIRKMFFSGAQGFAYDPNDLTAEKINWRRNLLTETEFRNGSSDVPSRGGNVSPSSFIGVGSGQTGLLLDTSERTVDTYAYKTFGEWKANVPYTLTVFLRMQDSSAPVLGMSGSDPLGDIGLVIKGTYVRAVQLINLGGGLYRATATVNSAITSGGVGVVKYKTFTARPVLVTGYQLEEGTQATPYQPFTDFNSEFLRQFPLHTLFQDAVGTIPVTVAGQPVGLLLDKSRGIFSGIDLKTTAQLVTVAGSIPSTYDAINDVYAISRDATGGNTNGVTIPSLKKSTVYLIDIQIIEGNLLTIRKGAGIEAVVLRPEQGRKSFYINTAEFDYLRVIHGLNSSSSKFRIFSVKEVLGNHAYQTVSASRPILQQTPRLGVNKLASLDFTNWSPIGSATTTTKSFTVIESAGGIRLDNLFEAGKTYKITAKLTSTATTVLLVNASNGATPLIATATGGTVDTTYTATSSTLYIRTGTGTTTVTELEIKEVTGYRTDQNYLAFDGVDDFLQTNNIDFTATDKVSLFAGVRKLSDAATSAVCELSDGSNTSLSTFALYAPAGSGVHKIDFRNALGGVGASTTDVKYSAPVSVVVTGNLTTKDAIKAKLRLNGLAISASTNGFNTNLVNAPLYIGRRGGTSLPFNGHLYGLIGIGRLASDSETKALEKAIAKNTGVTLNV